MKFVLKIFDKIESGFFFVAKIALFVMMVLTTADAIMRYVFNHAITGAYTFTENYLMVIVAFLSMSYVMKLKGHIRIDIFTDKMPKSLVKWLNVIYLLAAAGFMFAVGYKSMFVTWEAYVRNYVATGVIPWPTWLSWIWVPIGAYLFTIRLLLIVYGTLRNKEDEVYESQPDLLGGVD
jgi:TRAP-type C4-dicarboxylate transport system permease small subunit